MRPLADFVQVEPLMAMTLSSDPIGTSTPLGLTISAS
jgi:hypothetical protein